MTHKKRLTQGHLFPSLILLLATFAVSPLQVSAKSDDAAHSELDTSWLKENRTEMQASSTGHLPIFSGDYSLVAEGKASYYSKKLHGKTTASGESFNFSRFTAAHRTLPFGTSVRVINLDNGKNVVVRINDRGPHMRGRIIDVSPAAAKEIGLFGNGTANVRIEAYN
jgi:rare lipoprotein A